MFNENKQQEQDKIKTNFQQVQIGKKEIKLLLLISCCKR